MEIANLPDYLRNPEEANFRKEPLLKYVVQMCDELCPDVGFLSFDSANPFLGGTAIFLKRYFEGDIDVTFRDAYCDNEELQDTLVAYSIDPSAFWYLILFLKDYVDDESEGNEASNNTYNELLKLAGKMYEMGFRENPMDGMYEGSEKQGQLKFGIKPKEKKNYDWLTIDDDKVQYAIFNALCGFLRKNKPRRYKELIDGVWEEVNYYETTPDNEYLFNSVKKDDKVIAIPETYKISYFATYMRRFLKQFPTPTATRYSSDRWLLISKLVFLIGYSDDERYNKGTTDDGSILRFLKDNYQKERYSTIIQREIYI